MTVRFAFAITAIVIATAPSSVKAAELRPQTLGAWETHIRNPDSRMQNRLRPGGAFLWVDEAPDRFRRIPNGDILASPVTEMAFEACQVD